MVLCGTVVPEQLEHRLERRYLAEIHYLALIADPRVLATRLRARPAWRQSGSDAFVESMVDFNAWLRTHAPQTTPPMDLLDTSGDEPERTAGRIAAWVRARHPATTA